MQDDFRSLKLPKPCVVFLGQEPKDRRLELWILSVSGSDGQDRGQADSRVLYARGPRVRFGQIEIYWVFAHEYEMTFPGGVSGIGCTGIWTFGLTDYYPAFEVLWWVYFTCPLIICHVQSLIIVTLSISFCLVLWKYTTAGGMVNYVWTADDVKVSQHHIPITESNAKPDN